MPWGGAKSFAWYHIKVNGYYTLFSMFFIFIIIIFVCTIFTKGNSDCNFLFASIGDEVVP